MTPPTRPQPPLIVPEPGTWTSALDASGSRTFCGRCNHPLHWHECGAGADMTAGPCRCRNDQETFAVEPEPPRYHLVADGPRRGCSVIPFLLAAVFWGAVWVVTR